MRWLLFLSKLAFVCGFFFILSLSLLVNNWIKNESVVSTIITIGYFMGMLIVPFTILCYLILWLVRKKPAQLVPQWLVAVNIIMLCILLLYIVYVNYLDYKIFI